MGTHKPKLNRFQKGLYGFLYATVAPIYRRIIHYTPQDLSQAQPPYLVLANHNLTLDPVAVACAFKQPMCFVASEFTAARIPYLAVGRLLWHHIQAQGHRGLYHRPGDPPYPSAGG